MRGSLFACVLPLLAGACSTSDPDPQVDCLVPHDYGALGARTGTADLTTAGSLTIVLEAGPPKDDLFLKLVAGQGAFTGGIQTGTFSITGADASFTGCGLCTNLIADIVAGQGPTKFYAADSGTVTLTGTAPIAGSAQNLHFVEVELDGTAATTGCTAAIASISFGT